MFKFSLLICILLLNYSKSSLANWYTNEEEWPELCKNGKRQSPINIIITNCQVIKKVNPLHLYNYEAHFDSLIQNNGHSIEVRLINTNNVPVLSGGPLSEYYVLDNIHFHWFSEHLIDSKRFPLEAHFVHYEKKYKSLTEASVFNNSIVVLSVLFENSYEGGFFDDLFKNNLSEMESSVKMSFNISSILPNSKNAYFVYNGSLTTPACNENVRWIVFNDTAKIPLEYILQFQKLKTSDGELRWNFRPVQDLSTRQVSFFNGHTSSSNTIHNSQWLIGVFCCSLIYLIFNFYKV